MRKLRAGFGGEEEGGRNIGKVRTKYSGHILNLSTNMVENNITIYQLATNYYSQLNTKIFELFVCTLDK